MYPRNQNQSLRKLAVERREDSALINSFKRNLRNHKKIFRFLSSYLGFIGFIAIHWIKITARIDGPLLVFFDFTSWF